MRMVSSKVSVATPLSPGVMPLGIPSAPIRMPIAQLSLTKNGTEALFDGVAGDKVYVAVAFDEKGVMTGDGPPPTGAPVGVLMGADMMPASITPGDKGVATLTFDDTIRMP